MSVPGACRSFVSSCPRRRIDHALFHAFHRFAPGRVPLRFAGERRAAPTTPARRSASRARPSGGRGWTRCRAKPFDVSLLQNLTGWSGPAALRGRDERQGRGLRDLVVVVPHEPQRAKDAGAVREERRQGAGGRRRARPAGLRPGAGVLRTRGSSSRWRWTRATPSAKNGRGGRRPGHLHRGSRGQYAVRGHHDQLAGRRGRQAAERDRRAGRRQARDGRRAARAATNRGRAGWRRRGGDGSRVKIGGTTTASGVSFTLPEASAYARARWPAANKTNLSAGDFQGKKLPAELGSGRSSHPADVAGRSW